MKEEPSPYRQEYLQNSDYIVQRITALWAFSEAGLGGILHALNIPLKGLILSSIAALCMTLIAYYAKDRSALLRSLAIVLSVKFLGAPNSSPLAYIAVSVQGLAGYGLFALFSMFGRGIRLPALLLAVIATTYSSVQKILVAYFLLVFYGESTAKAIKAFINNVLDFFGYSGQPDIIWQLGAAYVGIHAIAGIMVGIYAATLPRRIEAEAGSDAIHSLLYASSANSVPEVSSEKKKRGKKLRMLLFLILPLVLLAVLHFLYSQTPQEGIIALVLFLVRIICILALWYGVIADFAMKLVKKVLQRKEHKYAREVENVLLVLPLLRNTVVPVWQSTRGMGSLRRLRVAFVRMVAVVLHLPVQDEISTSEAVAEAA